MVGAGVTLPGSSTRQGGGAGALKRVPLWDWRIRADGNGKRARTGDQPDTVISFLFASVGHESGSATWRQGLPSCERHLEFVTHPYLGVADRGSVLTCSGQQ